MRRFLFWILLVVAAACKKEKASDRYAQYYGKWELEGRSSFWSNQTYAPGKGNLLVLGKDGTYERIGADTVRFMGRYSLAEKKECIGENKKVHLGTADAFLAPYGEPTLTLYEDGNYLVVAPPNCTADMDSYGYRRVK